MKLKRILAIVLCFAMVLSTMSFNVFAEEADLTISTAEGLKAFAASVNAGDSYEGKTVVLSSDIDMGYTAVVIGTKASPFMGTFDGQGYTVSNITIYEDGSDSDYFADSDDCLGLFGVINTPAVIKNVTVNNPYIVGSSYIGGIVGMGYTGTIENCHVTGEIDIEGFYMVGGINGHGYAKITNCSVIGAEGWGYSYVGATYKEADLEGDNVGGIVGHNGETNDIIGCEVKNITVSGTRKVGGIVGIAALGSDITNCAVSNITVETTATEEYATAKASTMSIGGLVGQYQKNGSGGTISGCEVSGLTFANENDVTVSAGSIAGGFRGTNGIEEPAITVSDTTVSSVSGATNDYFVPTLEYVATVNGEGFTDLQAAIVAAAPNGTVEIVNDVTVDEWKMFWQGDSTFPDIIYIDVNGLTINGNNHTLTVNNIVSATNGDQLFKEAKELNINDLTINVTNGAGGIGLESGTIKNVIFNGGTYGIYPGTGEMLIEGCSFATNGTAIYFETARDNLVVTNNTFSLLGDSYAIILRGGADFTDNNVISGKVNLANDASGTVSGNDFNDVRFKVYNGATATISNNTINNLVFNDESKVNSTFNSNTLSEEAQAVLDAADFGAASGLAGTGEKEDPYLINNIDELKWFRDSVNDTKIDGSNQYTGKYIKLTSDIDLKGEEWTPIGVYDASKDHINFQGIFDGDGHKIYNLKIDSTNRAGFFGELGLSTDFGGVTAIKNITFENVDVVSTAGYVGAVASNPFCVTFDNVHVTGKINVKGGSYTAGIAGHGYANFNNCSVDGGENKGTVESTGWAVGGIAGHIGDFGSDFTNCTVKNLVIKTPICGAAAIAGYGADFKNSSNLYAENVDVIAESTSYPGCNGLLFGLYGAGDNFATIANSSAKGCSLTEGGEKIDLYYDMVAEVGGVYYTELQSAIAAAQDGDTITLLSDVELEETLVIAADKEIVLDLNGKTVTYNSTTQGEAMITNKGTLTINDSSDPDTGVINYNYTGAADSTYGKGNYTISNGGILNVNGGKITIANLKGHAKYPIDNNSTTGDAILVINGGHLYNYNTSAIRQFCNSTTNQNSVTVNGGLIEGYCAIWAQNPGSKTVNGSLSITGGEIKTTAAAYVNGTSELKDVSSRIYCTIDGDGGAWSEDSTVSITGGTINENVSLAEEAPATITVDVVNATLNGYVKTPAPAYVAEVNGEKFTSLQDAENEAVDGDTITLLGDIELTNPVVISGKSLTLDLGEYTICDKSTSVLTSDDDIWGLIALENDAKLTICGNGTIDCNYQNVSGGWTGMAYCIDVDATSELTVNGGNFVNGNGGIQTRGKVTVNNGIFVSHNGGTCIMAVYKNANVTVNDGIFKDSIEESDVYTGSGAVWSGFGATVTINGGTYDFAADPEHENIVWTLFPAQNAIAGLSGQNANMTVTGGTFINFNPATDVIVDYSSSTGFTFGSVVADEYAALESMDGKFFVGTKPTATVNDLGKLNVTKYSVWNGSFVEGTGEMPLNFVMQFVADQNEEDMETSPYADWYADFVVTVSGLENGSFVADGCYLAGYYEPFGWVKVPIDGMTIEEGVRYPVMLGVGLGQKYEYICSGVKDFRCAMFLTEEVLAQNPDLKVNLELAVVDNSEGGDAAAAALQDPNSTKVLKVESIEYTAEDFEIKEPTGKVAYRAYVNDSADREGIQVDLNDVYAEESLVVKLFDPEGNLLTTTTLKAGGAEAAEFTCNIVLDGRVSGSWDTVISAEKLSFSNMPEKIEVWCDGILVDTFENALGAGTSLDETAEYIALDCVVDPVAQIGETKYETFEEAITAAEDGDVVTLLSDVALDTPVTIKKSITIDGGEHTITYTDSERAIDIPAEANGANVTIKNLTVVAESAERGLNYNTNGKFTVENVTVTGGSYAINFPSIADDAEVYITDSTLTALIALNVWGSNMTIEVTNSELYSVDDSTQFSYSAIQLNRDEYGNIADGTTVTVNGGKLSGVDENNEPSIVVANWTATGNVIISDTTEVIGEVKTAVAMCAGAGFYTLQDAIDETVKYNYNAPIVIIRDIELTESVKVPSGANITLDLNGKTITGTDNATGSFALIEVQPDAELIINDAVGTGAITLTANNDRDWNAYSSVISNQRGKLTVNGGAIEHLGGTDMAYGIDNLTNTGAQNAETIINGGTVKSTYRAIRQFLNSTKAQNILTINGGTVEGANKSIWMQDANASANPGVITVAENAVLKGDVYLTVTENSTEWPVEVSIAAAALSGESTVLTNDNVPEGYEVVLENGYYGVQEKEPITEIFTISQITTSLDSSLALNIYLNSSDPTGEDYYAVVEHTKEKGDVVTTKIPFDEWVPGGSYKAIRYTGIAAKEMADKLAITIYSADDKQVSKTFETSLRDYAIGSLQQYSQNDAYKHYLPVFVDMLNYGAAAQIMFNYNTSFLANVNTDEFQKHASTDYAVENEGLFADKGVYAITVSLENMLTLNVYFKEVTEGMKAKYSYTTHDGTPIEGTVEYDSFTSGWGHLGVSVDVAIADAATPITVTMLNSDGTEAGKAVYSVNAYLNGMIVDGAKEDIYPALIRFAASAKEAFAKK